MADLRTEITEIITGLGMTGNDTLEDALATRSPVIRNVTTATWDRLEAAYLSGAHLSAFTSAWHNGRAFFESPDGLRGRIPIVIEWKGAHQPPGYDFLPVDLRIDHVYLVSCKYQSRILSNSSPANLFDRRLADRSAPSSVESWYATCAPEQYQHFYSCVRREIGQSLLPVTPQELTPSQIQRIRDTCRHQWPPRLTPIWTEFSHAVALASAERWIGHLTTSARRDEMLWRLLRLNPASYFLLGDSDVGPLRLRVGTPWDWRQRFALQELRIEPTPAGQPRVSWQGHVTETANGAQHLVGWSESTWWGCSRSWVADEKMGG